VTGVDIAFAARVVIALVLVVSGVSKLVVAVRALPVYRKEGPLFALVAFATACSLPIVELLVAAALLLVDAVWPVYVALALFAVFSAVLVRRMMRDDRRPCNCFGAASRRRALSVGSLVRNGWFLVLAVLATGAATMTVPSPVLASLLIGVAFAAVSATLIVRT
jgi:hypothetical protein